MMSAFETLRWEDFETFANHLFWTSDSELVSNFQSDF